MQTLKEIFSQYHTVMTQMKSVNFFSIYSFNMGITFNAQSTPIKFPTATTIHTFMTTIFLHFIKQTLGYKSKF